MYKGYEVLDAPLVSALWSRNSAARLPDGSGGQRVKRALRLALLLVLSLAGMAQAQDRHYKPIPRLTPGDALNVTAEDICRPGHAEIEGKISVQVKSQVFDRYGIRGTLIGYNVDHLIPPGLGGSNSIKNLWPEPLAGEWTYQMKSRLERRLRKLVCSGTLDLKVAQQEIATDWIAAYKKYYPLRLGVKIFNVTNHSNRFPEVVTDQRVSRRDYQGNLASAEFAGFYNGVGRRYGLKFVTE